MAHAKGFYKALKVIIDDLNIQYPHYWDKHSLENNPYLISMLWNRYAGVYGFEAVHEVLEYLKENIEEH